MYVNSSGRSVEDVRTCKGETLHRRIVLSPICSVRCLLYCWVRTLYSTVAGLMSVIARCSVLKEGHVCSVISHRKGCFRLGLRCVRTVPSVLSAVYLQGVQTHVAA